MKRGKTIVPAEKRQLYLSLRSLSPKIPDANDYGTVLGYVVFYALMNFKFAGSSDDERMFRETKRVYRAFEEFSAELENARDYLPPLYSLQIAIEKNLEDFGLNFPTFNYKMSKKESDKSRIYFGIIDTLFSRKGNPLDRLRRSGIELDRVVSERGFVIGNRCCLLRDYEDIFGSFVRIKGDRRG